MFYLEDQLLNPQKGIQEFSPTKVFNRFFNILNMCFTIIPYLTEIFWWEGYTDVDLDIDDIVMHLSKKEAVTPYIWNYLLVSTKFKINTRHWVIYNMFGFVNDFCISCWWCKRSYFSTWWISNVVLQPICTRSIKISSNNWTKRKFIIYLVKKNIKICTKDFEFFLTLTESVVSTG